MAKVNTLDALLTMEALGRTIRKHRRAQDLTEQALAEMVGVSRPTIQRIEKGELSTNFKMAIEICQILGIKKIKIEE